MQQVLVVDDEPGITRALARELQQDYEVTTATSLPEALALLDELPRLGAVVTDLNMGRGEEGLVILREVRRRFPGVRRVLVSASASSDYVDEVLRSDDAQSFVAKPWVSGEVLRSLSPGAAGTA